ncbi:hypothetical protein Rsub_08060 [Raphidocelis subcapitata]|uniref:Uncharacterized protein n=1 Tax=Raphidocelis subcapitata TaxID=307507 RepID=A0A2V0PFF7_9CHLO|nr:hypothetical protein Rsub_08060 [Raphidocelis subcapitata]|eukprot:GBF95937.1 hypothetical protein Rsub_08060 [Raphidocelis subcapitata]
MADVPAATAAPAALSDAALANGRHIARCAAQPWPRPLPADAVTRGFEAFAYPKLASRSGRCLVRELRGPDGTVRRKAVLAARELLASPSRAAQCVAAGAAPALVALLRAADADDAARREAAGTLRLLARREPGARDLLRHGGLPALLALLPAEGNSEAARDEAYGALEAVCLHDFGRSALAALKGALPALMSRARAEAPHRAARALEVLVSCASVRPNDDALGALIFNAAAVPDLAAMADARARPAAVAGAAARLLAALCSTRAEAITQARPCLA